MAGQLRSPVYEKNPHGTQDSDFSAFELPSERTIRVQRANYGESITRGARMRK